MSRHSIRSRPGYGASRLAIATVLSLGGLLSLPATASAQQAAAATELESIIVTARKRSESLSDVPVSATVVTAEQIEARGVNDVKDILTITPNVSFPDPGSNNLNTDIVIRGISSNTRNVGFESGVGVYVDGVYLGRPLAVNQELVSISQIEVLRGPQGTVFGKNNISGAVNINLAKIHTLTAFDYLSK